MKKLTRNILSAFFAFAFLLVAAMGIVSVTSKAQADTLPETTVTKIQHRDANCNRLILFLENTDYSTVGATTEAPGEVEATGVTMLDNIRLYLDDNVYVTLRTARNSSGPIYYNVWGETNSICLDTKAEYGLGKIKYLTVLDGCVFPSAATHAAGYVQKGNVTYRNEGYGTSGDCTSWTKTDTAKTDGGVAVNVKKIEIRDDRLFFYFDGNDYADATANSDASAAFAACNIMQNVTIWTSETTGVSLAEAAKQGGSKFYNLYASGAIALEMGANYGAAQVKMVTVKNGCQFPDNNGNVAFVQWQDVTYRSGGVGEDGNAVAWTVTDTPSEGLKVTAVTKVQVRDNKLFIFLSKQNFDQATVNAGADDHIVSDALLENIEIYAGETHASLKNAMSAGKNAWYNHYGDMGCLAIALDGSVYTNASVSKIVVKEGCEFPSALTGASAYITDKEAAFVSGGLDENKQSTKWTYAPEEVYLRANAAHIRGGYRTTDGTIDDKLLIFFATATDIVDAPATTPIDKDKAAAYNFLDKIMLYTTVDADPVSLKQAYTSETATGEMYYNIWGEQNCIAVQIGKYSADEIVKIYIPQGTEFPSYEYTSGNLVTVKKYVAAENIYLKDWAPTQENHAFFSTNWAVDRNYGEIGATGVTFADATLEISLTGTDYPTEGAKRIDNYFEYNLACYDHITFDGVSLADYIDENEITSIDSWINATAYGTFAIRIEGLQAPAKIIIRQGCQLPIYANTVGGVEIHDVLYYEVSESVMFVKQEDGSYKKSEKVTWTVTFDGGNAVEVEDGGTVAQLPVVEKAGYKFLGWKLNGADFTTSTVITADANVQGKWAKVYTVTFDTQGGSSVDSQVVEEESYITKPEDPVKEGYVFLGWVDADGNEFDFNAAITSDVTVVANWKAEKKGGCGGMAGAGLGCAAVLILGSTTLFKKKKEN
ncbi:MAG: InlB B-repeat-containing protein [Candidatus Borkfalkiaceae bacterium]|nr:InlB B-repeat-containing protein [Clostridia bacterium]MDY6223461.1 InlB B-repeat-containing protein [Christensenellaceae bacterium]